MTFRRPAASCSVPQTVESRAVGRQNLARAQISDAESVLECLRLLLTVLNSSVCQRHDLVVENLLLRHQLAVLTRPTRTRPRARLRLWDKLHWVLARRSALAGVSTSRSLHLRPWCAGIARLAFALGWKSRSR